MNKIENVPDKTSFYGDVELEQSQVEYLKIIEKLIGGQKIPNLDDIEWTTFGFKAEKFSVVGLCLYDKELKTIPEVIVKLKNLQDLVLTNNQITKLPETIGQLKNLQNLILWENKLTSIPKAIGNLKKLIVLKLESNQITTIPEALGRLKRLKQLYFCGNGLTTIPEVIYQLKNLQVLCIANNKLTKLPNEICHMKKLKVLDLGWNQIESIPEAIEQLKNLQVLSLEGNNLTMIPNSVGQLSKLQDLDLRYNTLKIIPETFNLLLNNHSFSFSIDENCPCNFPQVYRGNISKIREYFQFLSQWSPAQIVEKIRNNQPLSNFDKENHKIGEYVPFILEKIQDVDTNAKNYFLQWVDERFSVQLNNSDFKIQL